MDANLLIAGVLIVSLALTAVLRIRSAFQVYRQMTGDLGLTVTPAAYQAARQVIAAGGLDPDHMEWRLRLTVDRSFGVPDHKVEVDFAPPLDTDHEQKTGRVRVLVDRADVDAVRGAIIDHGQTDGEFGFIVTAKPEPPR